MCIFINEFTFNRVGFCCSVMNCAVGWKRFAEERKFQRFVCLLLEGFVGIFRKYVFLTVKLPAFGFSETSAEIIRELTAKVSRTSRSKSHKDKATNFCYSTLLTSSRFFSVGFLYVIVSHEKCSCCELSVLRWKCFVLLLRSKKIQRFSRIAFKPA